MRRLHLLLALALACLHGPAYAEPAPGTVLWDYRTDGAIWGSPVLEGGTLYFGSDDRRLYALDLASHRPRWTFTTGGAIRARPAVAGDLVYAASDDGFLYAVDRATGRERWRFDLKARDLARRPPSPDTPYFDYLQSAPLVHEGQVFIGSLSGTLFVVDAGTGALAWSSGTLDAVRSSPVIAGGRVYFASWDDHLYAVDLATHELLWRVDTGGIVQSTPALGEGKVVVGSRSARLVAYDAATGAEAWRHDYPDGSWVESSPVYAGGRFYVGSSDSLKLSAFAADTGRELWHFTTGGWTWATPRLAGDTLYIGAISATPYYTPGVTLRAGFFALDAATGTEKWRFNPGLAQGYVTGGVSGTPEVADGVVYVTALDGHVYALKE
jgi:outer membrane protein assembly factor BamB